MAIDKVVDIEDLPSKLETLRESHRIVHCHGVFDLLHIGHIRHFTAARKLGDILVVTVTPDRYVKKGPDRPVFTESLRAEAVAALDNVDFVAINNWPTAVEAIRLIRPNFYVKGAEYRNADKDHTGGILVEQETVEDVGGEIAFTDDIVFSSSSLITRNFSPFPPQVNDFLASFRNRYSVDEVVGKLTGARKLKVLVIGETIIDEYQYCEAIGKSSKEPMLAMRHLSTERFAGGILAVANHIANFCDSVDVISALGEATAAESEFLAAHISKNVNATFIHRKDAPTIVKRRFVDSYFFTKMLEIYEMNPCVLCDEDNAELCKTLGERITDYDLVIAFDFGHGLFTPRSIDLLCSSAPYFAVNVQANAGNLGYNTISRYRRADFICIAENEMRLEARDRTSDLTDVVLNVAGRINVSKVIATQGKLGCLCFDKTDGIYQVPAFAAQVVDRMGAGDAFFSIAALCGAQGAPIEMIGFVGNAVAAHAVATVGHRESVDRASLIKHVESLLK